MPQGPTPIPSDWDGQTWLSLCVQWPNSLYWRGILRGLLSLPSRGRFWDGSTGSIASAQSIGRTIRDSNFDFPTCGFPVIGGEVKTEKHWVWYSDYNAPARNLSAGGNIRRWTADPLYSDGDDCLLSADGRTFSLADGDYKAKWRIAASRVGKFGSALRKNGETTEIGWWGGMPAVSPNTTEEFDHYSEGIAFFSIDNTLYPQTIQIMEYAETGDTYGQGRGFTLAEHELVVWGYLEIWKFEELGSVVGPAGIPGPQGPNGVPGLDGPGVLMRSEGSTLQWAQEDQPNLWFDLIDLCDLSCEKPEQPPEPLEGACLLATGLTLAVQELLDYEKKAKEENFTLLGILNALATVYAMFWGPWYAEVVTGLVSGAITLLQGDILEWYPSVGAEEYSELKCMFLDAINTWGDWNNHSSTLVRDWVRNRRDAFLPEEPEYKWWQWVQDTPHVDGVAYGLGFMAKAIVERDNPEVDCSECEEPPAELWSAITIFNGITEQGFADRGFSINPIGGGSLVESIGVVAYNSGAPNYICSLHLRHEIPSLEGQNDTNIHYIQVAMAYPHPATFSEQYGYDEVFHFVTVVNPPADYVHWADFILAPRDPGNVQTLFVRDFSGEPIVLDKVGYASDDFYMYLHNGTIDPGANLILKSIKIWGTGYNPYDALGWESNYNVLPPDPPYF